MSDELPYLPLYVNDYLADEDLACCSDGAERLWIRLLCYLHKGFPYGHLAREIGYKSNTPPTVLDSTIEICDPYDPENTLKIANREPKLPEMVSRPETVVNQQLAELELYGVFSRTPEGIIYCRRMVRDHEKRLRARGYVAKNRAKKQGNLTHPPPGKTNKPRPKLNQSKPNTTTTPRPPSASEGGTCADVGETFHTQAAAIVKAARCPRDSASAMAGQCAKLLADLCESPKDSEPIARRLCEADPPRPFTFAAVARAVRVVHRQMTAPPDAPPETPDGFSSPEIEALKLRAPFDEHGSPDLLRAMDSAEAEARSRFDKLPARERESRLKAAAEEIPNGSTIPLSVAKTQAESKVLRNLYFEVLGISK